MLAKKGSLKRCRGCGALLVQGRCLACKTRMVMAAGTKRRSKRAEPEGIVLQLGDTDPAMEPQKAAREARYRRIRYESVRARILATLPPVGGDE
mgnify:CR=1 FL=1